MRPKNPFQWMAVVGAVLFLFIAQVAAQEETPSTLYPKVQIEKFTEGTTINGSREAPSGVIGGKAPDARKKNLIRYTENFRDKILSSVHSL